MRARPFTLAVVVALAHASMVVATAGAASDDSEAARLFQEAKELMDQGRFAEACPKLDRSRTLDPHVGTTLNLALCYERLGKTASSWSMWLDGAAEAGASGQNDREALARRRAAGLEARLLRITILVAPQRDLEAIDLQLDGVSIPKSRWGAPTPVDPGPHWVQATCAGKRPWFTTIEVDDQHVPLVQVGVLEKPAEPAEPVAQAKAPAPDSAVTSGAQARKTAAVILGSAGLAALASMSVLGLVAKSTYDSANSCLGNFCNENGITARDRAYVEAGLATAAGVTGVCALAGAAVLWFGPKRSPTAVSFQPGVGVLDFGLSLKGAW
jgi:hypothetical protein